MEHAAQQEPPVSDAVEQEDPALPLELQDEDASMGFDKEEQPTWDELRALNQDLAEQLMEFSGTILRMASAPCLSVMDQETSEKFEREMLGVTGMLKNVGDRVAQLRAQYEHLNGEITSVEDSALHTDIYMNYQAIFFSLANDLTEPMVSLTAMTMDAGAEYARRQDAAKASAEASGEVGASTTEPEALQAAESQQPESREVI